MKTKVGNDKVERTSVFGNNKARSNGPKTSANWGDVDSGIVLRLVDIVTNRGGAVRFGYSRDGGAYSLGLYYGEDRETSYCRPGESVEGWIQEWIEFYERLPVTGGKSPS